MSRHRWIRGRRRADRRRAVSRLDLPPALMPPVDAHRRLRGPYTAGAPLVRALAADGLASRPALVRRHDIEILALAPDLAGTVPVRREQLSARVPPEVRTRIHSRFRTVRIAHGIADFIRGSLAATGTGARSLVVENLQDADPCDAELFTVLLRRIDPGLLTLVLCTSAEPLDGDLGAALRRYAIGCDAEEGAAAAGPPAAGADAGLDPAAGPGTDPAADAGLDPAAGPGTEGVSPAPPGCLAAAYVASDGTADDPALLAAYRRTSAAQRALLHDARADELEGGGGPVDQAARLGAIPFHREHGSDPAGAGAAAVKRALDHCYSLGFHHASASLGRRGRALTRAGGPDGLWWAFARKEAMSLALLGRADEAGKLYAEARASSADPAVHHVAAYGTAMLRTRYHEPHQRDYAAAREWANEAIAIASLLPDQFERSFHTLFYRNGLALIEMRLGRPDEALRLVDESLDQLARELPAGSRPLDRCSLLSNRARLLAILGRAEDAARAYDALVDLDPSYGEYRFDRGNFRHSTGQDDAALSDYDAAVELSLPFPEVHYNRAQLRSARGDTGGALADLDRAVELDPCFADAYVNRAGLLAAAGETERARADVDRGLALDPGSAHLISVLGQLEMAAGRLDAAYAAFSSAIGRDPGLAAAWAGRAAVSHERGDAEAAVADLNRALEAGEDAQVLFNRAVAFRAAGRPADAAADLRRALRLAPGDPDAVRLLEETGRPGRGRGPRPPARGGT